MTKSKITLAFINNYFDFKGFGTEIKSFIDDSVFFELQRGTRKMMNVYI